METRRLCISSFLSPVAPSLFIAWRQRGVEVRYGGSRVRLKLSSVLLFVILGELLNFSVPQFPYLENGDDSVHFQVVVKNN